MAAVYISVGRYNLAKPLLRKALLIEESLASEPGCIAKLQNLMGSVYAHKREYQKAEEWLRIAVKNFSKDEYPDVANFVACLTNFAGLTALYRKDYRKAALLYQKAYSLLKKIPPEKRAFQEIRLLSEQSSFYLKWQKYSKAKMLISQAKNIAERYNLLDNPWVYIIYEDFGDYFKLTKKYKKSLQYYQKALAIMPSSWENYSLSRAEIYDGIAGSYSRQKEYAEAIKNEIRAIEITVRFYGRNNEKNVGKMTYLAYLYFMNDDYSNALKTSDDVFHLCERLGWKQSYEFYLVLTTRAEIFRRLGREKDAAAVEAILHNKYNWK